MGKGEGKGEGEGNAKGEDKGEGEGEGKAEGKGEGKGKSKGKSEGEGEGEGECLDLIKKYWEIETRVKCSVVVPSKLVWMVRSVLVSHMKMWETNMLRTHPKKWNIVSGIK